MTTVIPGGRCPQVAFGMAMPVPCSLDIDNRPANAGARGLLFVVGGHSRQVGKTTMIEQLLTERRDEPWTAVKISAHRHAPEGATTPLIEEMRDADPQTQTGRYLRAGARNAFLVRAPDAAMPQAAAFIQSLCASGVNVIVESNRIVEHVTPDAVVFVIDPHIADWKPSSDACLAVADAVVYSKHAGAAPAHSRGQHHAMIAAPRVPPHLPHGVGARP